MRPLKYQSVEELQAKIDAYFASMEESVYINNDGIPVREPLTITGLALALDTTRQGLINYEEREEFYDTIKLAKTRIENYAEKRLFTGNATGPIFALKNYGWKDTQDVTRHTTGEPQIVINKNYHSKTSDPESPKNN